MKFLSLVLSVLFLSFSAQAKGVGPAIKLLKEVAYSSDVVQLKGTTPEELVLSFLEAIEYEVEEGEKVQLNLDDVYTADETRFGTTSVDQFSSLMYAAIEYMDENAVMNGEEDTRMYPKSKQDKVDRAVKLLEKEKVIFSWNPVGASVCGMTFTTVVVIDPKTKKAYEFNFYDFSAGCQAFLNASIIIREIDERGGRSSGN